MTQFEPWSDWITATQIESLHAQGLREHGGKNGSPPEKGCLERSLGAAYNAELYSMPEMDAETVISGLCFCGYLLFYLIQNNCFIDGNKRAGWTSAMYVLLGMDLTLEVSDDEAEKMCLQVASGQVRHAEELVIWIAEKLKAI
jgi:prophage maintenance system killer protein